MIIRVRSCDSLEHIAVPDGNTATVATLHSLIESQLGVPAATQTLSLNANLLLSNPFVATLSNPFAPLSPPSASPMASSSSSPTSVSLAPSALPRLPSPPLAPLAARGPWTTSSPARSVSPVKKAPTAPPPTSSNAFQLYVTETLAFAIKCGGFLYG